jgi:cytochrome bd-type quinol oxidase subunit 2
MLASTAESLRLFAHIFGATIWVGGQFTMAALVPILRSSPEISHRISRGFNRIAWPAYGLLIITGAWNVASEADRAEQAWWVALTLKILLVLLSGGAAVLHMKAKERGQMALWGALAGFAALGALYVGVLLRG